MQTFRRGFITTWTNDSNHDNWDANSRFLRIVALDPQVADILSDELSSTVITLNLRELDPVMADAVEDAKQFLHPRPHLFPAMINGVVLVVKCDIFGIELEAGANIVSFIVDGVDVSLEEPLCRRCWFPMWTG
jgi:hypothetical protein